MFANESVFKNFKLQQAYTVWQRFGHYYADYLIFDRDQHTSNNNEKLIILSALFWSLFKPFLKWQTNLNHRFKTSFSKFIIMILAYNFIDLNNISLQFYFTTGILSLSKITLQFS